MRPSISVTIAFVFVTSSCADDALSYGRPESLVNEPVFPGTGTSSSSSSSVDGGAGGAANGLFPAAYDPLKPPAPTGTTTVSYHGGVGASFNPRAACLQCHDGSGAPPAFAFAGYVGKGQQSDPIAGAEVIVTLPSGSVLGPVKTSADGYFWLRGDARALAGGGAKTAVRDKDGAGYAPMSTAIDNGSCAASGCHSGSRPPPFPNP